MKTIPTNLLRAVFTGLLAAAAHEVPRAVGSQPPLDSLPPTLHVVRQGSHLRLVWPGQPESGRDPAFGVEETPSLLPPISWSPAHESPEPDSGPYTFDTSTTGIRFFRLVPITPEVPVLASLTTGSPNVVLGGTISVTFQLQPGNLQISTIEVTLVSGGTKSVVLFAPETLGISSDGTSGSWLLHTEGLGFGTAELTLRSRDAQRRFSEPRTVTFEVVPESATGSAPVLRSIDPPVRLINRPTDPLDPVRPSFQVLFEDPDHDALRLEAVIHGPAGLAQSLAWELREDQRESGDWTVPFPELTPNSEPGVYEARVTVWDRNGHASNPGSARLEVRSTPAAVIVQGFEPAVSVPGGRLVVHGSGFDAVPDRNTAFIADRPIPVLEASNGRLELGLPLDAVGGPIRIVTPEGSASSTTDVVVAETLDLSTPSLQIAPGMSVQLTARWHYGTGADGLTWSVDGIPGGSESTGRIDESGLYTAPARVSLSRSVVVRAAGLGASGFPIEAEQSLRLTPSPPAVERGVVSAETGGTLLGTRERVMIQVPPGAIPVDTEIEIAALNPTELVPEIDGNENRVDTEILAVARLGPDGLAFSKPAILTLPLTAWMPPGTRLRMLHRSAASSPWIDGGIEAVVNDDGFTASGSIPHFSDWMFQVERVPRPEDSLQPRIDRLSPGYLLEGSLQPFLVEGTNFSANTRIEILDASNPSRRVTNLEIRERLLVPERPGQLGLLIRSSTDRTLAVNATRTLVLRVSNPGSLLRSEATFQVRGLDEYIQTGGTNTVEPERGSQTSRRQFSQVSILGTLRVNARVLDWSATDSIEIFDGSFIDGSGRNGLGGSGRNGGIGGLASGGTGGAGGTAPPRGQPNNRYPQSTRTYRMLGADSLTTETVATWSGQHGNLSVVHSAPQAYVAPDAHVRPRYGYGGSPGWYRSGSGYPWGNDHYGTPANIYRSYAEELPDPSDYDPGDREFFEDLLEANEDFMTTHPDGRRGSAALTDDWMRRRLQPSRSLQVESHQARASAPGHGGGGGGGSGANSSHDGLGGGAGGEGGHALRFTAAQSIYLSGGARISTTGGNGGNGARRSGTPVSGGGGGPGSGGTLHLLAGRQFTLSQPSSPTRWNLGHGSYGSGGFLALHIEPTRQIRSPWERPARATSVTQPVLGEYTPPPPPAAVFSGPEFTETRRTRSPLVTQIRPFTALELEGSTGIATPILEVRLRNRARGERRFDVRDAGTPNDNRRYRVRLLLDPGFNRIELGPPGLDPILIREILVVPAPDSDGDGLTDPDERTFGLNPVNADSDGDGTDDASEWVNGTGGNDPEAGYADGGVFGNGIDLDGDGWSDAHEIAIGTLPNDPTSVPRLSTFVAHPKVRSLRPGYQSSGLGPLAINVVVARPRSLQVLRPGLDPALNSDGTTVARPYRLRTEPQ